MRCDHLPLHSLRVALATEAGCDRPDLEALMELDCVLYLLVCREERNTGNRVSSNMIARRERLSLPESPDDPGRVVVWISEATEMEASEGNRGDVHCMIVMPVG